MAIVEEQQWAGSARIGKLAAGLLGTGLLLGAGIPQAWSQTKEPSGSACVSGSPAGPMEVTSACEDPLYNARTFRIDKVSEASSPLPHTRVDAHFEARPGQPTFRVTFYLPSRDRWQGRFFQHAYPLEQPENLGDISFALSNGAYLVNVAGVMCGCGGYRPDAAAAKLARDYAATFYGTSRRIHGYLWGGSGGGLLVSGAIENVVGVWDGAIPYVMPNAASLANVNAIGSLAGLALSDRLDAVADAAAPGSRTDLSKVLDEGQRAVLEEALSLGTPFRTFEDLGPLGRGSNPLLMILTAGVKENDPAYVDDFWTKPGYEGSNPPAFLKAAIREEWATVTEVIRDDSGNLVRVKLDRAPSLDPRPLAGLGYEYWLYGADGSTRIGEIGGRLDGDTIVLKQDASGKTGQLGQGIEALMKRATSGAGKDVVAGQTIKVNNLNFLALHYYHRHAMPVDRDMYPYDQFRHADGSPKYPQRPYLAATSSAVSTAGGGSQTGRIRPKVIVMQSMVDSGAQPWMADWYAKRVRGALGPSAFERSFRVYLNENAGHIDSPPESRQGASLINYVPALHQAVLDLVGWVERGVAAPPSSRYTVSGGQLLLAGTARQRRGIQPVVKLTVNGGDRIEVRINEPVVFRGVAEAPPQAGRITATGWWFGDDAFSLPVEPVARTANRFETTRTHAFARPGTYFVSFKATSQRQGDTRETATAVQNIARVRVIVK